MSTPTNVANEALQKVKDQLDCAICLQSYTDPKLLSCFHVFCAHCLTQLVVKSQDGSTITCPKCRRTTPLLQSSVAGLQSAFHVHRLFEIQDTLEKVNEAREAHCNNPKCNKAAATGFCRDCKRLVCEKCTAAHQLLAELASHKIVSIADIQADTTSLLPPKKVMYCLKHPEKKAKVYCETCYDLICSDCTFRLHKDHHCDLVTDAFPKHRDEILAELKPVRQHLEMVNKELQASDTRKKEIVDQRQAIEADINRRIDQLHQALDQRRVELVEQLEQLTQQKLKSLAAQKDQIKLVQTQLSSCLKYVEGSLKTGTEGEILAMKAQVVRQIQQMVPEIKSDTLHPQEKANLVLVEDDAPRMMEACQQLAAIVEAYTDPTQCYSTGDGLKMATVGKDAEVTLQTRDQFEKTFSIQTANITAELVCSQDKSKVECNITKVEDSKCLIRYQPVVRGKHQLHITIGGEQTVGSPHAVFVRPRPEDLGKPVKVIGDLRQPWGVAVNSKGLLMVAENGDGCVSLFTPEGEKFRSFGSKGTGDGHFYWPRGVTVDGDDNIYVADNGRHCVQKFTPNGKYISSVGSHGVGPLQFQYPSSIGFNRTNSKLYICDHGNHRIQVLDTNFVFLKAFGSKGNGNGMFQFPRGVGFDSDGNVYIADSDNNRIQVFTPEGQYVGQFGSYGSGRGQLSKPNNIAVDKDTVYVTESANCRVSVFTTTGQFLNCFGSSQEPRSLRNPQGVTIDENGFIVVSDTDNHLINFY